MPIQLPDMNKKNCPIQHQLVINENKNMTEKLLSYPILCPLCHLNQRKNIKNNFTQLMIYFNVACQVHIFEKKASTKRGHFISQVHNTEVKWYIKPCIFEQKKLARH